MARKTRQVESRLIAEYLKEKYSAFPFIVNQPLGTISETLMAAEGYSRALRISRPFRPEVDAVVLLPRHLLLVEAKVWNVVNGLAKLPLYKSLVPLTPELKEYQDKGIIMQLVVGWSNTNLEVMARDQNVSVVLYCPDWLVEVVEGMHKYWTAEYQQQRQQKLALREYFGLE